MARSDPKSPYSSFPYGTHSNPEEEDPNFARGEGNPRKAAARAGLPAVAPAAGMDMVLGAGSPAAGGFQAQAQGAGTGQFVNFDRYIQANQGTAGAQAEGMYGSTARKGLTADAALTGATQDMAGGAYTDVRQTPGYDAASAAQGAVQEQSQALTTDAGREAYLQKQYGSSTPGGYTSGAAKFDAALTGAMGQGAFDAQAKQYANFDNAIQGANAAGAAAAAPNSPAYLYDAIAGAGASANAGKDQATEEQVAEAQRSMERARAASTKPSAWEEEERRRREANAIYDMGQNPD